ncbi:V-set and immunoglobulin domain-containing protein 2-like [Poecilia reticulata]|uniref:V-set and immunoglobulin domain-containing protein 2-like n=1 Tax=Poecilia reticulata TaxID=8081 RepID=UPI0004A2FC74|nr:PREDICTED: V-set and immunoglobulin domain-containing protein 2-like [Poecilia reticulata]
MSPGQFAVSLTFLFSLKFAQTIYQVSSSVQQGSRFVSVKAGESVTVQCFYNPNLTSKFDWYKLSFGQKPKLISTAYKYERGTFYNEFKDNPRFTLDTKGNLSNLRITNLQPSDSATYFCISGHSYKTKFDGGTVIHVQESVLNVQALIDQQSETEIFQPGGSVTLNCTLQTGSCGGEHRVYWFRNSEEHYPGLIYTHEGSNDQCERKPGEQSNTCVFSLPLKNLSVSNAGTYYCAVASCGQILFGNGTNLNVKTETDSVYLLTGALVFTTFLSVSQAVLLFILYKRNHSEDPESQSKRPFPSTTITEGDLNGENLHYAALRTRRLTDKTSSRSSRQRNEQSDCVYSSVQM